MVNEFDYTDIGIWRHPMYQTWSAMMKRCFNNKRPEYKNYGGRGITVCQEWRDAKIYCTYIFKVLGVKPGPGYSIDRINNDGNYEPGNIRWATRSLQTTNQRKEEFAYIHFATDKEKWTFEKYIDGKRHRRRFTTLQEAVEYKKRILLGA